MKSLYKNIKKKWQIKKIVGLGFSFALLILIASSMISYMSTNHVLRTANDLSHSHKVYGILKEINSDIIYAQSCERAYVITGKNEFLNLYQLTGKLIKSKVRELKILTKINSSQQNRIEQLEPLIKAQFVLINPAFKLKLKVNNASDQTFDLVLDKRSKIRVNSIRKILENMENQENELLKIGTIKARIYSNRIKTIIIIGNLITFVVLLSSLIVIFIDISQRNYFGQELLIAKEIAEKSVQVKEHFLANMSHEIRTPMNAISGLTKILLKSNPSDKQKEYLDAIKTSSDILLVIINDILDLSKAEAGKMVFEKTDFKIYSLISSITDLLHSKAEEKNLKLITHFDENIPDMLKGDAVRLNQIILNLVSNAIKFTEKGEINLITKLMYKDQHSATIKFTVKDTGIGIPNDKLPTIFESFTQASTEITRKYGGTGLGLNIVKELVELQDGAISVESKENHGSTFSFLLKFQRSSNKQCDFLQKKTLVIKSDINQVNVLLVEDNMINQLLAQTVLLDFGFNIDMADNGKSALEKISENAYDIILMDIQMPEMSGYEVTETIRRDLPKPLCDIPILAMTANASKMDADKCINSGMNGYISKPFDEHNLYNQIITLVNKAASITTADYSEKNVDLNYIKNLSKGDNKFIEEIINLFIKQTPIAIENMKLHYKNKNWELLMAEAHKIKPSFNFFGIKKLEHAAMIIEDLSIKNENSDFLPESIITIETVCTKAIKELKDELNIMNKNSK
ncbi:MAG: ATP-binding protein [Bacteroidota bacterium]|nr:ATP-binding protein [Bacteroidota bacterium]